MAGGHIDDFHHLRAEAFAGPAGGEVVGVGGDPEGANAVVLGQGEEEPAGAFGVVVAATGGVDVVADVAVVELDIVAVPDAQANPTGNRDPAGVAEEGAVLAAGRVTFIQKWYAGTMPRSGSPA
jgi:hypothetical protein